jgi:DNA-binding transcriptional regulator YiaG
MRVTPKAGHRRGPAPSNVTGLGNKLRAWRERKGLSQAEAAKVLSVGVSTLRHWEQGVTEPQGLAKRALLKEIT